VLERWTRSVLRARVAVLLAWALVVAAGVVAAARLPPLLSNSFAVPGTDSARAATLLERHFGERPDGTFVVAAESRRAGTSAAQDAFRTRLRAAARGVPTATVGDVRASGGVLFGTIDTTLDLAHAKRWTPEIRASLARSGAPALVTGLPAIQHDLDPVLRDDLRRGEAFALPLALAVLVALFGFSAAVAVPFVFATATIAATLAAIYALAHAVSMVTFVTNVVELIGLGIAIDYSLLVVHRFREELAATPERRDDAVVRTMRTAGRAVVFSGCAVAIGLASLLVVPVPLVRSLGVGGVLIPLASIGAALTLQPALLSLLGARLGRPRAEDRRAFWPRLAAWVTRRRVPVLVAATAVMLALAAPAFGLRLTPGSFAAIPPSLESSRGLQLLRERVGIGVAGPTQIVVDTGRPGGARSGAGRAAVQRLADELFHDPETLIVASGRKPPYVDPTGRYARIFLAARHDYGADETQRLVRRLRDTLVPRARFPAGTAVVAGGPPPQGRDFLDRAYGAFPWLVAAVLVVTFLVLLRAFRSLVLPLKAVLLNLLTVAAVYGLLTVIFREPIDGWIPIVLFATLFGLSMDYEVFIVTRMREAWDALHDTPAAVATGLERTGRIVTAAAAVMCVAFAGFVVGRVEALRELGAGLALGVLLDATIVRVLLVPSLMAVLGERCWWLPPGLEGRRSGPPSRVGPPT
jgi:RND superfamily putative drug exporter